MLVYSLKKAALPAPPKQPQGTLLSSSGKILHSQASQQPGRTTLQAADKKNSAAHGKPFPADDCRKREVVSGAAMNGGQQGASNGATLGQLQPRVESAGGIWNDLKIEVPLRKAVSSPVEHPLFGNLACAADRIGQAPNLSGPCWYSKAEPTQLQKRKPEDASSRNSSSKRLMRPLRTGLQRIREMSKKLRLLGDFASLRVSRVTSTELPERGFARQAAFSGAMEA